jgi:peroxiredoxin
MINITIKKYLKISIPILVLGLLAFMGYKVISKINHKNEVAEQIKTIPAFSYKTVKGQIFSNTDLKNDTPTVFLYFNSECEHCQSEAEQIRDNIEKFVNVQLVFISFEESKKIMAFATKFKLIGYDKITFLCDSKVSFSTTFDVNSLPTVVIYDKNKKLIEKIKGQIKVENILKKITTK